MPTNRTTAELNAWWAGRVIDELVRTGVTCACMASGSRCSPLTLAAARHPDLELVHHLDERGLGYFAVGYARATGRAAAIITTSGTAPANLLPAVCEADASRLPLLVLSADRPPELRRTQANQTLVQPGMFGERVRWFEDLPCPAEELSAEYLRTTIDQAVYRTHGRPPGPVHLNLMFREPLSSGDAGGASAPSGAAPLTTYHAAPQAAAPPPAALASVRRGLLVIGEVCSSDERDAAVACAKLLRWPVCADVTSGLRFGGLPDELAVPYHDLVVPRPELTARIDGVVHLGGRVVSKRLGQALAAARPAIWIQVADHPDRYDPDHCVTHRFDCTVRAFADGVRPVPKADRWRQEWTDLNGQVAEQMGPLLAEQLTEPYVAREVVRALPVGHGLCLANSMPVRDVLSFAPMVGRAIPVCVNRGVSGIDGTLSTAAGFAFGAGTPATLLTGDLSLLHDLNALGLLRGDRPPVTVVAINNDGGGIFHFLPVAEEADVFEPWFATPHGLHFERAAEMYGLAYFAPATPDEFCTVYAGAVGTPALIEIRTNRHANVALHRAIAAACGADER